MVNNRLSLSDVDKIYIKISYKYFNLSLAMILPDQYSVNKYFLASSSIPFLEIIIYLQFHRKTTSFAFVSSITFF